MRLFAPPATLLGMLAALASLGGCSDVSIGPQPQPQPHDAIVSDPTTAPALVRGTRAASVQDSSSGGDNVVYVSLLPGTVPGGDVASIRRVGSADLVYAALLDGGFDPVPVPAGAGDTVQIAVDVPGAPRVIFTYGVPPILRPVVVRTSPSPGKRDVPLNATIVIVFSEPVDAATLTTSSMRLLRGTSPVAGTVTVLEGTGTVAVFTPAALLDPNTDYEFAVTTAVTDLDGDALTQPLTVDFRTGQSEAGPPASIRVSPDTVYMTGGTYQMTATVRDAGGNTLVDQAVTWSTSDSTGLTVSATGLVTALASSIYTVTATVTGLTASARVVVTAGPPASLAISPAHATVGAAGDTIILRATIRDAAGRVITYPSVTWASSTPGVATVVPYTIGDVGPGLATVTGVSVGDVTITATSGTASGTASVTVVPPAPVASVTLTPASATLLLRTTRRFSATTRDSNGTLLPGRVITWTTDNTAVATVDAHGLVTGVGEGSAAVVATSEGVSDTATMTVVAIRFTSVAAGSFHSCGLTASGAAYCWGFNSDGQLGDGSTISRLLPTAVAGALTFSMLSASSFHTCGVALNGTAYCWGEDGWGQLGDGLNSFSVVPVAVSGGLAFSAVSAGQYLTCGLTTSGAAYCWGYNKNGELGDGSTTASSIPVAVTGGLTFSTVSTGTGGQHTCGLTTSQTAYCWGYNGTGELGDSTTTSSSVPVAVTGGLTFLAVNTGRFHSCGLTAGGVAYCWGYNFFGQLGDSTTTNRLVPVAVSGGLGFIALAGGQYHTCGITVNQTAYCWGRNESGQVGDGTFTTRLAPVAVTGGLSFSSVSGGYGHTCGLATTGTVYCWGYNDFAQLGDGSGKSSNVPVRVAGQP